MKKYKDLNDEEYIIENDWMIRIDSLNDIMQVIDRFEDVRITDNHIIYINE